MPRLTRFLQLVAKPHLLSIGARFESCRSYRRRRFSPDAAQHGLGGNGFTIRVPAKPAGYGMVSFNSDLADDDWETYKDNYMGRLEVVACLVDAAAGRNAKLPSKKIELSSREHQALTWAARGRTASEIGDIMGVSYATARSHLEGARRRLDCQNVTHAVASALAIGVISPMALKGFRSRRIHGQGGIRRGGRSLIPASVLLNFGRLRAGSGLGARLPSGSFIF